MSGFIGGLGNGFAGLLQQAYWRGVPFSVVAASVRKGRKVANHDYPFRDGGWPEDMGRAQHVYQFSGYLIGDAAPLMQLALDAACEAKGPGLLIHPTLGAVRVSLLSATTSVHKEKQRVIEVSFQFLEYDELQFASIITDAIGNVLSSAADALPPIATDLIGPAVMLAAATGAAAIAEGGAVIGSFSGACATSAADPAAMVAMATALPPPDANTTYGRYGAGSASAALPAGTTVASLQAQLADQRGVVATTSAAAVSAASVFSAATGPALVASIASVVEAARATMTNPADQIRSLAGLCAFTYSDNNGGAGLPGDIATVRDAMAAACRRCAVVSLARAAAAYRPVSYDDAANIRALIAAAIDVEITAAGDAGDDATYTAFRALRTAVIQDLTARGASLPMVMTVTLPMSLPSLVVAYRLYRDSSRAQQIANEAGSPHPAFCPQTLQVLAA